jgi:hypothetical protein
LRCPPSLASPIVRGEYLDYFHGDHTAELWHRAPGRAGNCVVGLRVETYGAELTVTQPREIGLYEKAFDALGRTAVYGTAAALITRALAELSDAQP